MSPFEKGGLRDFQVDREIPPNPPLKKRGIKTAFKNSLTLAIKY